MFIVRTRIPAHKIRNKMNKRKYLPTFAELIDRLSITQLKEVLIPEHREEYSQEIQDILHDINTILQEEKPVLDAETLRALIVLSQYNLHIWHNESNFRKGIKEGNDLELTHGLNGIRNTAKNKIQEKVGGRKDYKVDNVEAFSSWLPSWDRFVEDKKFPKVLIKSLLENTKKMTSPYEIESAGMEEHVRKAFMENKRLEKEHVASEADRVMAPHPKKTEIIEKLTKHIEKIEESFNNIKNLSPNFTVPQTELKKVDVFDSTSFESEMGEGSVITKAVKKETK